MAMIVPVSEPHYSYQKQCFRQKYGKKKFRMSCRNEGATGHEIIYGDVTDLFKSKHVLTAYGPANKVKHATTIDCNDIIDKDVHLWNITNRYAYSPFCHDYYEESSLQNDYCTFELPASIFLQCWNKKINPHTSIQYLGRNNQTVTRNMISLFHLTFHGDVLITPSFYPNNMFHTSQKLLLRNWIAKYADMMYICTDRHSMFPNPEVDVMFMADWQ
jgi:hypothetical protein